MKTMEFTREHPLTGEPLIIDYTLQMMPDKIIGIIGSFEEGEEVKSAAAYIPQEVLQWAANEVDDLGPRAAKLVRDILKDVGIGRVSGVSFQEINEVLFEAEKRGWV